MTRHEPPLAAKNVIVATSFVFIKTESRAVLISSGQFQLLSGNARSSLFYFCCHSKKDVNQIKNALQNMNWTSFIIRYNSFSCNLDHDGKTVYLHALPSNQSW